MKRPSVILGGITTLAVDAIVNAANEWMLGGVPDSAPPLANNAKGELDHKRHIFIDAHGRMGLFTIKPGEGDTLILEVKITP